MVKRGFPTIKNPTVMCNCLFDCFFFFLNVFVSEPKGFGVWEGEGYFFLGGMSQPPNLYTQPAYPPPRYAVPGKEEQHNITSCV